MECNKEEAIKARTIAEKKLTLEDYTGAKRFILKAQRLDPSLGGLQHFMAVLDVQSSAQEVSGNFASNWHKILQVKRYTDEETIRKQYKKLLLLLHPDKNKFPSASAAFKLVKDAFDFFEQERDLIKVTGSNNGNVSQPKEGFFWTECVKCKGLSELLESFECQYVQCRHCLQPFFAAKFVATERKYSQSECQQYDDEKKREDKITVKSGGGKERADRKSSPFNREKELKDPKTAPLDCGKECSLDHEKELAPQKSAPFDGKNGLHSRNADPRSVPSGGENNLAHMNNSSLDGVDDQADQESTPFDTHKDPICSLSDDGEDRDDKKSAPGGRKHQKIGPSGGGENLEEDGGDDQADQESTPSDGGKNLEDQKSTRSGDEGKLEHKEDGAAFYGEKDLAHKKTARAKEPSRRKSVPFDNNWMLAEQNASCDGVKDPAHRKNVLSDNENELVEQKSDPSGDRSKRPEDEEKKAKDYGKMPVEDIHGNDLTQAHVHEDIVNCMKSDANLSNKKRSYSGNDSLSSIESLEKRMKKSPKKQTILDQNILQSVLEIDKRSRTKKDDSDVLGSFINMDKEYIAGENSTKSAYVPMAEDSVQTMKAHAFEKLKMHIMKGFNEDSLKVMDVRRDPAIMKSEDIVGCSTSSASSRMLIRMNISVTFQLSSMENQEANNSKSSSEETIEGVYQVPESDIYNFDKERQEESFEPGQIWAVYDDDDGLPRFYAHIMKVVSVYPFAVLMKWLYPSQPVSRDVRKWLNSGFAYTCGEFELREEIERNTTSIFSHLVAYEFGRKPNTFKIYPQKGDVWAMYKKWKPQRGMTSDCMPVLVVSQYNEESGVVITPLFPVEGYRSVFFVKDNEDVQCIPKGEITRFSHQIPAHHLGGGEAVGLPDNCVDLDTSAMFCS